MSYKQLRGLRDEYIGAMSANIRELVAARIRHHATEAEHLDGCEWATKYRFMGTSSAYDRWDTARTPYLAEIAEVMASHDPAHRNVVIVKSAQCGVSECILNDALMRMHTRPAPMLHFMETAQKSAGWMSDRLEPALRQQPFADNRSIKVISNRIEFPNGFLICAGAGSSNAMSSVTAKVCYLDELARFPQSVDGEGDALTLLSQRTKTFEGAGKIIAASTPVDKLQDEGSFYSLYSMGDERVYEPQCPHCEQHVMFLLEGIVKYEQDGEKHYGIKCPSCEQIIRDGEERDDAIARGRWRPTKDPRKGYVSFHVSGLLSPSGWRPLEDIYLEHENANMGRTSLQAFWNVTMGEFYSAPEARTPDYSELSARMNKPSYKTGKVPNDVCFLTLGIDVQRGWLSWGVIGWTKLFENYHIDRGEERVPIEHTGAAVAAIRDIMAREFPRYDGNFMKIRLAGIDSGWGKTTSAVYALLPHFPQPIVTPRVQHIPPGCLTATKGASLTNADRFIIASPGGRTSKGQRRHLKIWRLGSDIPKRELYRALRSPVDSDDVIIGKSHAPDDYEAGFYKELVSEKLVPQRNSKSGKMETVFFLPPGQANESLDIWVISRAMAEITAERWNDQQWEQAKELESYEKLEKPPPRRSREQARADMERRREEQLRRRDERR